MYYKDPTAFVEREKPLDGVVLGNYYTQNSDDLGCVGPRSESDVEKKTPLPNGNPTENESKHFDERLGCFNDFSSLKPFYFDDSDIFNEGDSYSNSDETRCEDYSFNSVRNCIELHERPCGHFGLFCVSSPPDSSSSTDLKSYHHSRMSPSFNSGYLRVDESTLEYIFSYENNGETTICMVEGSSGKAESGAADAVPGTVLPIDDGEYAVIKSFESDHEISYEIYSSNMESHSVTKRGFLHNRSATVCVTQTQSPSYCDRTSMRKSFSFSRYMGDYDEGERGLQKEVSRPSDDVSVARHSENPGLSHSSPEPGSPSHPSSCLSTAEGSQQQTRLNTRGHSHSSSTSSCTSSDILAPDALQITVVENGQTFKEKCCSLNLFESNGLFMKRDHPIFAQTYSRKVFVGGLPRDITIDEIQKQFSVFGPLHVDWPNRDNEAIPPNGFAFLHFDFPASVNKLHNSVCKSRSKNKFVISSYSVKVKEVEVKFWKMSDSEILRAPKNLVNPIYTVFVGALPRIATAKDLANFMERRFSNVAYAAIDVDLVYGYPKGAGRVTFGSRSSYQIALDSHYVEMDFGGGGKRKRIEIKPFLLPEQKCDICVNNRLGQSANKYCYRCGCFVCEKCETDEQCVDQYPHNVITRPSADQSAATSDAN